MTWKSSWPRTPPLRQIPLRSCLRERMPSLVKTLRRCHSTVRGLMNSWAPISGLVSPSPASRAICASCAVRTSLVSTDRLRTVSPVASSSRRARSAKASTPMSVNMPCAVRSCSRASSAPVPAAEPLAVEEVRSSELDPDAGAAEPLDRLAVEDFGSVRSVQQRARTRFDAQRPVGAAGPVVSVSCSRALAARTTCPLRTAASMSSTSDQLAKASSWGYAAPCSAASRASW